MKNKKITIVGAGLTGLVAGYRLSQKGYVVTIYEKNSEIGGLMGEFKIDDVSIEKTYHHIFRTDKYMIDLIDELGLQSRLKWYPEKTAVYYDKKIYPFVGPIDLLKFKPLDLISKIRLGLVKIWLEKDNEYEKYIKIPAYLWMKKWCGEKAYKVIWEPLLKGKFHDKYKEVSMAWLWARIHTRANSDGNLGYLDGGFQQVTDELAKRIKENGGKIKLNYELRITNYELGKNKIIYTGALKNVEYLGAVCVVFTSSQNLSPYYWHNINDLQSPFVAFIQHTNLVDKKQYDYKHVYYLGTYGDEKMDVSGWFEYLKKIVPEFEEKLVEKKWVFRMEKAQHLVKINHKKQIHNFQNKNKNVIYANFAQIFPEDRGTNFAVREGERAAKKVLQL